MTLIYNTYLFFVGTCLASFYYLLAQRLPIGKPIGRSRSTCDTCHHVLGARDLFPLLSCLFNRGRCRYCHTTFGWSYFFYELFGGLLFAVGFNHHPHDPIYFFIYSVLFIMAAIDHHYFIIPDRLQLILLFLFVVKGELYFFSGAFLFFIILLLAYLIPEGMGGGDIKLIALFGLHLGFQQSLLALLVASLFGLLIAQKNRKEPIPFAPFLVIGYVLVNEAAFFFG